MLYRTQEMNFTCLILRSLWASENGQNLLLKWHPRGANNVMMVSLIQEQWRTYVYYICHYSTYPIYVVSINLFCWPPSVDIFNILPGFFWQPLLNDRLPTKREKNNRLPTGKILTDYRHGPTLGTVHLLRGNNSIHLLRGMGGWWDLGGRGESPQKTA